MTTMDCINLENRLNSKIQSLELKINSLKTDIEELKWKLTKLEKNGK